MKKSKVTSLTTAALAVAILAGINFSDQVKADVKDEQLTTESNKFGIESAINEKNIQNQITDENDSKANSVEERANSNQTLQQNYDAKQKDADFALKQVDNKKEEVSNLKNQLSDLKNLDKNTIDLGDANKFKQAYVDYIVNGKLTQDDITYSDATRERNHFVPSNSDKDNQKVDLRNLTDDQVKELSLFSASILDKVRKQLGLEVQSDQVNPAVIEFGKRIAQKYTLDKANGTYHIGWHDATAINDVAKDMGLHSNEKDDRSTSQYYEDMTTYEDQTSPIISMNELKSLTYDSLLGMIIPDGNGVDDPSETEKIYEMDHTAGLLGLRNFKLSDADYNELKETFEANPNFGEISNGDLTFHNLDEVEEWKRKTSTTDYQLTNDDIKPMEYVSAVTTYYPDGTLQIHFYNVAPQKVSDKEKFGDTDPISSYDQQITDFSQKLKTAAAELDQLIQVYDQKKAISDEAYDEWQKALQNISDIQKINDIYDQVIIDNSNANIAGLNQADKENKSEPHTKEVTVILTHNAFIYDHNGQLIKKGLKVSYLKQGQAIKATDIVKINGKKYYQIGEDKFVKVTNTKIKTHVVKLTGIIKGKKSTKVKTYSRNGKATGHYVCGKRKYKFNEQSLVNGKVFYKVAGKNIWVQASKVRVL